MLVKTKYFGELELEEEKLITFEQGLLGLKEFKKFVILYNNEKSEEPTISWLQSLDDETLALPIVDPLFVKNDYNPMLEDELLGNLGEIKDGSSYAVYVTLTVPSDLTKMTANLKAPIVINIDTLKGCQVAVENDYPIRYNVYDAIQALKEKVGD